MAGGRRPPRRAFRPDVAFEALAEAACGTTVQWAEEARDLPWIPERGSLDTASTTALARALERFAAEPDVCTFALWEGYASEAVILTRGVGPRRRRRPRLDVASAPVLGRRYAVFQGPVAAAPSVGSMVLGRDQSPNLWWDPAWLVVTDVDLMSTFVGCDEACAQALLADEALEAVPIERDAWVSLPPPG